MTDEDLAVALPTIVGPDDVGRAITGLVNAQDAAETIAKALGFEAKDIPKIVREQRRQFALLMYAGMAPAIYEQTQRYLALLDRVLTTLEQKPIEEMKTVDLLTLHREIARWVAPLVTNLITAPRDLGFDPPFAAPSAGGTTMNQVLMLVQQAHRVQEKKPIQSYLRGRPPKIRELSSPEGDAIDDNHHPPGGNEGSTAGHTTPPP